MKYFSGRSTAKRVQKTIKPAAFRLPPTSTPRQDLIVTRQPSYVRPQSAPPPTSNSRKPKEAQRRQPIARPLSFEGSEYLLQRPVEIPRTRNVMSKFKTTTVRADYDYYDDGPTKVMEKSKSTKV